MRVIGVIPARIESSRLPRKLLLDRTGKPLIQYTWEAASKAKSLEQVIVATDSPEIAQTVRSFGGRAEMTGDHPSGTDRIAEVIRRIAEDVDIVVNIQGDEPEIDAGQIDEMVASLAASPMAQMATLCTPIHEIEVLRDPSCTKVVCAADGRALYFSRSPIPHTRDRDPADFFDENTPFHLHLGLYAYRREYLLRLTELPPSRLERLEKLEQLRALEDGAAIQVVTVDRASVGIDTADDYARFVQRQTGRAA